MRAMFGCRSVTGTVLALAVCGTLLRPEIASYRWIAVAFGV